MTAEVAIINKNVIAVAADSAVTVGETKVHRSTTKIFAVSGDIAAMVYGYSELGGMPWEILLKLFRAEHGQKSFPTIEECYKRFREFVNEPRFRLETGSIESLVKFSAQVIEYVRNWIEISPEEKITARSISSAIAREERDYADLIGEIDFDCPDLDTFSGGAGDIIWEVVKDVFKDTGYKVPKSLLPNFTKLVHVALNSGFESDYVSGFVMFGFGNDQLFPELYEVAFDCVPLSLVRSIFKNRTDVIKNGPDIYPLADREVMDSVISGITDHLKEILIESTSVIANEVAQRIIRDNLPKSEHLVSIALSKKIIKGVVEDFSQTVDAYIAHRYLMGMVNTIENMPKEDIAVLAEALVEITALRIKSSDSVESVSGPVDVCVITKGDGLVWIKRKHYFDLNKNLQYLYRRFGGPLAIPIGGIDGQE